MLLITGAYHSEYCTSEHLKANGGFWEEYRKLFPTYNIDSCRDSSFPDFGLYICIFFCWIILFIILIIYIVNFCLKINSGLILDKGKLHSFICSLMFLLPTIILYICLTPFRTSFDKPEKIYIFSTQTNKRIEGMVKTLIEKKIYGVIGLLLLFLVIGTTLTKIYILKKGKEQTGLDAKFITNQINPNY